MFFKGEKSHKNIKKMSRYYCDIFMINLKWRYFQNIAVNSYFFHFIHHEILKSITEMFDYARIHL